MSTFEMHFGLGILTFTLRDHPLVETWTRMGEFYYNSPEYEREELAQNFDPMRYEDECNTLRGYGYELLRLHGGLFNDAFENTLRQRIFLRSDLNYLHAEYERIRTHDIPFSLPEAFNDQIHICERFHRVDGSIRSVITSRPRIRTRFIHKEWGASAPWKLSYRDYDYKLFEAPVSGRLYLCYCEVGKPPFSAYRDRDTVQPVPWRTFGPAFYITFQNWQGREDYTSATKWLEEQHGPGVYWMGEPCLGELTSTTVEDAFCMVRDDPAIREMRWKY